MRDEKRPARLQTLLATARGSVIPLPARLARLYGEFRLVNPRAATRGRPRVMSNFVTTLDGVVSLKIKGHEGGGDISGFSTEDRMVMGLLRAVADVVIVGGGSLAADPHGMWTAEAICPELAGDFRRLRQALHKEAPALKVVVSATGHLDVRSPVFTTGGGPLVIVTSRAGARRLADSRMPASVEVRAVPGRAKRLAAGDILRAVCRTAKPAQVLVEGGPRLLCSFFAERLIDEQFLTLAPQLAGREVEDGRISLVMGQVFAPKDPRWATLADVRRSASHLFLRYIFGRDGVGQRRGAKRDARRRPLG